MEMATVLAATAMTVKRPPISGKLQWFVHFFVGRPIALTKMTLPRSSSNSSSAIASIIDGITAIPKRSLFLAMDAIAVVTVDDDNVDPEQQ